MTRPALGKDPGEDRKSLAGLHLAVLLFGLAGVVGRSMDLSAALVTLGRTGCSFGFLLLGFLVRKKPLRLRSRRDLFLALTAGVILAAHWTAFFQSVQTASVAVGTITFSTFPLFVTFLEPLIYREKLRPAGVICAGAMFLGVLVTVPAFSLTSRQTVGILWGMAGSVTYAALSLFNRTLSDRYPGDLICLYEQGAAAAVLLPVLFRTPAPVSAPDLFRILFLGVVSTALAHSLYVSSLRRIRAQTAGIVSGLETVYGVLFAWLLLGEPPTLREALGGGIILGSAVAAVLLPGRDKTEAAPFPAKEKGET